ncbi:uncharacterized protein V6R79_005374 [Siganus canaliculatus]
MAEELNYASVVFKTRENSAPEVKTEEETVYDQVKVKTETHTNTGRTKADHGPRHQLLLACVLALCVVLLLSSIVAIVWLTAQRRNLQDENENLATLNHSLRSENENLKSNNSNLTVLILDLTRGYRSLENMVSNLTTQNQDLTMQNHNVTTQNQDLTTRNQDLTTQNQDLTTRNQDLTTQNQDLTRQNHNVTTQNQDLTTQNQDLTTQNQQLETQRNDLTEKIQQMESVEANVSRAEWAVGQYCYKKTEESGTSCHSCQKGWLKYQQGCYAYNNLGQQNWEGAQKDCEGKVSELAVAHTEAEKEFLRTISVDQKRYWIGLRVVDGKWKWVDGSDLTEASWVDPPAPSAGHCALSVQKENKWKSVNCSEINQWICEKTAINPSTGQ